jgi:hypothetical protein
LGLVLSNLAVSYLISSCILAFAMEQIQVRRMSWVLDCREKAAFQLEIRFETARDLSLNTKIQTCMRVWMNVSIALFKDPEVKKVGRLNTVNARCSCCLCILEDDVVQVAIFLRRVVRCRLCR